MRTLRVLPILLIVLASPTPCATAGSLTCADKAIQFEDAYAGWQLLVANGEQDVTRDARYESSDPAVARVDAVGYVTPSGDGSARIRVQHGDDALEVPVRVSGFRVDRPVDFGREIVPLLSRMGCNAGGCHGKASGQNGFKLSLFGFDAAFDYDAIAKEARGRRVFPAAPEHSLLLLKATGQVPHGGGKRLQPDGSEYPICPPLDRGRDAGLGPRCSARRQAARHAERSRPEARSERSSSPCRAEYSDGSHPRRDPTGGVRQQSRCGRARRYRTVWSHAWQQSGEAAIMARYMGQVAVFRAIVPHGEPLDGYPDFPPINYIDELAVGQVEEARPAALAAARRRHVPPPRHHRPVRPAADRRRGARLPRRHRGRQTARS